MVSLIDIYNVEESAFERLHEIKSNRDPARGNKAKNREKDFYFIDEPADPETGRVTSKVVKKPSLSNMLKDLADNQKTLLKEYVNSVTNSPSLKAYINEEIKKVKRDITKYAKKITDKAVVIKLNETKGLIKPLCKKSSVHDDNVSNLLNYYELINELKEIHG